MTRKKPRAERGGEYNQSRAECDAEYRHQVDTVVEGIGINRITQNFSMGMGIIDDAVRVTDEEAVAMSRYLVQKDGLWLGSSSACNLVASIRLAKRMPSGSRIVTIL